MLNPLYLKEKTKMKQYFWLFVILAGFILYSGRLSAQNTPESTQISWDSNPKLHDLSPADKARPEIILLDHHWLEYYYDKDELHYSRFVHKIVYVFSPDAIDRNNKIYLPVGEDMEVVRQMARVIKPNGKVVEISKEAIRSGVDDETNEPYRYFAVDGLEPGSELEYLLEIREDPDHYGIRYVLQGETPRRNLDFRLISPPNLIFALKSLNGLADPVTDTLANGKNIHKIIMDTLAGVEEEEFAPYRSNLMAVVFKLDKNLYTGKKNLVNYISASQSVYNMTHQEVTKAVSKVLKKVVDEASVEDKDETAVKIRKIEDYVKANIRILEHTRLSDDVEDIFKNKAARIVGAVRLYTLLFEHLGIAYETILTTNRHQTRFEPKFEAFCYLDDYLMYFPDIDQYITPDAPFYRLGIVPNAYINTYGLFIKPFTMGDVVTGIGEVRKIPENKAEETTHNTYVTLDLSKSLTNPELKYKQVFGGYYAMGFQPYFDFIDEEKQKELVDDLLKGTLKTGKFTNVEVENKGIKFIPEKPLVLKAMATMPGLVENAGEKYLFKLGELIGPQAELYKKNTRVFDIENDFNRIYYREIEFTLPEGYKLSNPEVLEMKVEMPAGQTPTSGFVSKLEKKGPNTWLVKVDEYYRQLAYPKALYEEYRKVINAAADFNKIVLLIEKQ